MDFLALPLKSAALAANAIPGQIPEMVTRPTSTANSASDQMLYEGVLWREGVAALAVRLPGMLSRDRNWAPQGVLASATRFQVIGVYASPDAAEMIESCTLRNGAFDEFVDEAVCSELPRPSTSDSYGELAVSSLEHVALPQPTTLSLLDVVPNSRNGFRLEGGQIDE